MDRRSRRRELPVVAKAPYLPFALILVAGCSRSAPVSTRASTITVEGVAYDVPAGVAATRERTKYGQALRVEHPDLPGAYVNVAPSVYRRGATPARDAIKSVFDNYARIVERKKKGIVLVEAPDYFRFGALDAYGASWRLADGGRYTVAYTWLGPRLFQIVISLPPAKKDAATLLARTNLLEVIGTPRAAGSSK